MAKINNDNKDDGQNDILIAIPYGRIQEDIGRYDEVIEYKFESLVFKQIVINSFPKQLLLISGLTLPPELPFLIGIKVEVISITKHSANDDLLILCLRVIEGVQVNTKALEPLGDIARASYSVMNIAGFACIQQEVEELILDIKYIQDENMPLLPLIKDKHDKDALARYSYQLCFFIVSAISKCVKIDNLEEFFCGYSHIILRKVRYELLKYLEIRAKEDQKKREPIFEEKLRSGKILPLIILKDIDQDKIIPVPGNTANIYISREVQKQLIRYTENLTSEKHYVVLIPEIKKKDLALQNKETKSLKLIGVLATFRTIFTQPRLEYSYQSPKVEIIPEKMVKASIVQKKEHKEDYERVKYTYYCEAEDLEYEVHDEEELKRLLARSIEVFRKCLHSESYLPRYNYDVMEHPKLVVELSNHMISYLYDYKVNAKVEYFSLLQIQNLEQRFKAIESKLLELFHNRRKELMDKEARWANNFIRTVTEVPAGYNIVVFYHCVSSDIYKCFSLLESEECRLSDLSVLTSERIQQSYYGNSDMKILLIKGGPEQFDSTSVVPSILARVNNILITEDNDSNLYIAPEKRVRVTEVVLKEGVFYGKAEEIIEPRVNSVIELNNLRRLVDKLIAAYPRGTSNDVLLPVFNPKLTNFETYAANICYYIAAKRYGAVFTKDELSKKFFTENIIGKLSILIDYFEGVNKELTKDVSSTNTSSQDNSIASGNTEVLYQAAKILNEQGQYGPSLECCDEGLSTNPNDQNFIILKNDILGKMCQTATEEDYEYLIQNIPLSLPARNIAIKELNIIKSLNTSDNERADHVKYLRNILSLPWGKYSTENIDLEKASEILNQEHYGLEEVKNRILETLVFTTRSTQTKTPIICLVGPPGVGKTSVARSVANALGRKFVNFSLAGSNDVSLIKGCMSFYRGSHPGKILSLLTEAASSNPVVVLDEIDKIDHAKGNSLESALLQLLDPEQNNKFTDDYFDFPFDLSKVFFITTANSLEQISFPLINRMEVIELGGYTDQEKLQITNNYLMPKLLKEANLVDAQLGIDDDIIKYLIKYYTKESGVRDIEKTLRIILQKYLVEETKGNKPQINLELIKQYLGEPKYPSIVLEQITRLGSAMGLAYTSRGGSVMTVEAEKFRGDGKIKATGKLGEVLKESVETAFACIKANAESLSIPHKLFKEYDIHIHLPEGAVSKDGPSAGITIYVALVSLLSGKEVRQDIAMTGELTLKGQVLPIGGLKEKLSAAVRDNMKTVVIPEGNIRDLAKIPEELKDALTIKTISDAKELLDVVFSK